MLTRLTPSTIGADVLRAIILLCCASLALTLPASAQLGAGGASHITAELQAESTTPRPGGSATLALMMTPEPGWHGYWKNGGDAGLGIEIEWDLPTGVTIGEPAYPVPHTLVISGLMNHVYERPYALPMTISLAETIAAGTVLPITGRATWLACTDKVCVPERGEFTLRLRAGDGRIEPNTRAQFDRYRAALPLPLGSKVRYQKAGDRLRIAIPLPADQGLDAPHVFIETEGVVDYAARQGFSRAGDTLVVETVANPTLAEGTPIDAVLSLGNDRGLVFEALPGPVPEAGRPLGDQTYRTDWTLVILALAGAILGGLLLNIMPCVFPILSLKALALARTGSAANATARTDALAYAAGAVLASIALGAILLALRAAGSNIGWAFQLQDSRIVALLLLLMVGITANLAGVFELPGLARGNALAERPGGAGSFWTGALAAFVATPCSGPFLGAALGATLVLPAPAALAIFAGLGFGLALPFLAIGFVPALRRSLPKPGAWMERFRHWLAIPMGLTALALGWLLWRQAGDAALAFAVLISAAVVGLLWLAGRRQRRGVSPALAFGASVVFAIAAIAIVSQTASLPQSAVASANRFTPARLAELRATERPVFVYFTADWCVTCKANEAGAIDTARVREAFDRADVTILVADWTSAEPVITRELASHGRNSVPLYLWYAPGAAKPEILPQILIPSLLIDRAGG